MYKVLLTLLTAFPLMAMAQVSTTTSVDSISTTTTFPGMMDPNFTALQSDVNRLRLENAKLEKENTDLEAEIKKLKKGKNLLLGTTIAGAAGTTVGGILWAKNKKEKKVAQGVLDMLTKIEKYQKENPVKFAAIPECMGLSASSSEADLKNCAGKL
ncbi:MAG: hypothetical protein JW812_00180 [Alphaproteobacteria bacterium]|nr:hypothetical protein [Alphaproteobacteria bacterium]MBN2779648.1 hypothetical protein [Alphaproteobacteria bacterium]